MTHSVARSRFRPTVVLAVAGGLAVSACNPPAEAPAAPEAEEMTAVTPVADPTAAPTAYTCDGGRTVSALYTGQTRVDLTRDGKTQTLTAAPSGSGARYVGPGVEWRTATRGAREVATLTRLESDGQPGPTLEQCSRPAPAPIRPAVPPPCTASQLRLSLDGGDAGMGNRVAVLGLANAGPGACVVSGYPGVTPLDARGAALANVVPERGPSNYFNGGSADAAGVVPLAVGAKAVFDLAWNVVPNEAEGQTVCPAASSVRVTVGGEGSLSLGQTFTPCGGRIRVSPLRPADKAPTSSTPAGPTPKS